MNGGMPWTRTALPFQGAHCLANRSGSLVRLTFQIGLPSRSSESEGWSACGDIQMQKAECKVQNGKQVGRKSPENSALFIMNSAFQMVGDPGLAPGRVGDFKSPWSAIPAEASRREMACQP